MSSKKTAILRAIADLGGELERLASFGDDVYDDGAIITFKRKFINSLNRGFDLADPEKEYQYAALKVGGRWYVTGGRSIQGATWDDLVDWATGDAEVSAIRVATKLKKVTES